MVLRGSGEARAVAVVRHDKLSIRSTDVCHTECSHRRRCFSDQPGVSADGGDRLSGIASVYDQSSGAQTASGEPLCEEAMTAAHRSLPFGTVVRVINRQNGQIALVRNQ